MKQYNTPFIGTALVLILASHPVKADENQVYVGQTGVTNTISIDQYGTSNKVGADETTINVYQDGTSNTLTVNQEGYANEAGATSANGTLGLEGIAQIGANNTIDLTQQNSNSAGNNRVGAIYQSAPDNFGSVTSNSLTITQTNTALNNALGEGDGQSGHSIGEIQQIQTGETSEMNIATIRQYDGASGSEGGNVINQLVQNGSGNLADITQQYRGNLINVMRQLGTANEATIIQRAGTDNEINSFLQAGAANRSRIEMTGSRNLLLSAIQNNELVPVAGNIMTLILGGDDNGGDGLGGLGQFVFNVTKDIQVAQAEIKQLGDDNSLNYVTSGRSFMNQYGFVQDGDGNWLSGTVDGEENETAVSQVGDGNRLNFSQSGEKNALAVLYRGKDNELYTAQTGNENTINISFDGGIAPVSRSNQNNDAALGGFSETALAYSNGLTPGQVLQNGNLNLATLAIHTGSFNKFAYSQNGDENEIDAIIEGNSNQSVVVQGSSSNYAYYRQYGNNNQLIILQ
ncbi:hypothetical protein [uncultured Cohaesibacter sp.]|uniref:hypothetical protein n=1 Tax=uncultured Cohaesibacter sp. TaxID=1002546 RepID=UPI0029312A8C|nr:hypothetical protein [uncultured Cohaesibacter sp.]